MLLMMTLPTLSQSIKKDSVCVDKQTFVSIVKESRLCDSLKVSFAKKSALLDDYVLKNILSEKELQKEQARANILQEQINQKNNELIKLASKKNNAIIYGVGGVAVGVVVTLLIVR